MKRLKASEISEFRSRLLAEQKGKCALCGELIDFGEDVLDHNHKTGEVRAVLHRGCNAMEGKITNNLPRNKITPERLSEILKRYEEYIASSAGVLHHTHRTPEEKRKLIRKRRARNAKRAKK
jgi:hypothetical protein